MKPLKCGSYFFGVFLLLVVTSQRLMAQASSGQQRMAEQILAQQLADVLLEAREVSPQLRILYGTINYLESFPPTDEEQTWAIVSITPIPRSRDRKVFLQRDDGSWYETIEGTVKMITPLSKNTHTGTWNYKWELPAQRAGGGFQPSYVGPESPYRTFRNSNPPSVAICRIQEGQNDIDQFSPFYLIPAEWAQFVVPAQEYRQAHPDLFREFAVAQNWEELLQHENPFLAVIAADLLVSSGYAMPVAKSLAAATGWERTMLTFLLLHHARVAGNLTYLEAVEKNIETARDSVALWETTLGIYAALDKISNTDKTAAQRRKVIHSLLEVVDRKQAEFKTQAQADKYLDIVLRISAVRPLKFPVSLAGNR